MQKCKLCHHHLLSQITKEYNTIILAQEFVSYKGKVTIPIGYSCYYLPDSRAAIFAPSTIPLFLNYDLSGPDCTVVNLTSEDGKKEIYLASIYLDINNKNCIIPPMAKLCRFLQENDKMGILGIDSNSHSTLFGSPENNSRGDIMDLFVFENHLDILNRGKKPTFVTSRAKTIVDISLAYKAKEIVQGWKVLDDYWFSDHRCIEFNLIFDNFSPPTVLRTQWELFSSKLQLNEKHYSLWNPQRIEAEAAALSEAISEAVTKCSTEVPRSNKMLRWWNDDLSRQKRAILNLARIIRQSQTPDENLKNELSSAKKLFYKATRKARRLNWQKFCEDIDSPKKVSLLNKVLKNDRKNHIGILKDQDNVFSNSMEDTLDLLLATHFPESEKILADKYKDISSTLFSKNIQSDYLPAVGQQKVNSQPDEARPRPNVAKEHISAVRLQSSSAARLPKSPSTVRVLQTPGEGTRLVANFCSSYDLENSFINEKLVYEAVMSFKSNKAAGPDGFKSTALKHFVQNKIGLARLTMLFNPK